MFVCVHIYKGDSYSDRTDMRAILLKVDVRSSSHILPTFMSSQPEDDSFYYNMSGDHFRWEGEGWFNKYYTYDLKLKYSPDRRLRTG